MTSILAKAVLGVLALWLFNRMYQQVDLWRRIRRARKMYGAELPPWYPHKIYGIKGMDLVVKLEKAEKNGVRGEAQMQLHRKHGATFVHKHLMGTVVRTTQPEVFQALAATQFDKFGTYLLANGIGEPFIGPGVFTENGHNWKIARSSIRPLFARVEVANLNSFAIYVDRFLALLPRDGSTVDIQPLLKCLYMDVSTEFLFGESTRTLFEGEGDDEKRIMIDGSSGQVGGIADFITAFDDALKGLNLRIIAGPMLRPLMPYLDPSWKKAYDRVHAFVDRRVQISLSNAKHRSATIEKNSGEPEATRGSTGADTDATVSKSKSDRKGKKLILLDELAKESSDPIFLRNQILNVFFPARDTTALVFSNILFYLCRHPQYWKRLRTEALAVPPAQLLAFDRLKGLPWAKACINETLRLRMPAGRGVRVAFDDVVIPLTNSSPFSASCSNASGAGIAKEPDSKSPAALFIPRGYLIEFDMQTLQCNPAYFGPDAHEFRPERWLAPAANENEPEKGGATRPLWEAKWQYLPYLGGLRMCPAQQQTLIQMTYLLARMTQEVDHIECRDDQLEYREEHRMTVESRNGVKMALWTA